MTQPGLGELLILGAVLATLAVHIPAVVGLWYWSRWVASRQPGGSWKAATWLPIAGGALMVLSWVISAVAIASLLPEVAMAGAEDKTTQLGEGIDEAMAAGGVFAAASMLLLAASSVVSLTGTLRRARPQTAQ